MQKADFDLEVHDNYLVVRGISVRRVRCAQRLEQDLGVNIAGAALALELLEELERLRARLHRLEG